MPKPFKLRLVLKEKGFYLVSQSGSHAKYRKDYELTVLTVIVPIHGNEIQFGTFGSILRQANLQQSDFEK